MELRTFAVFVVLVLFGGTVARAADAVRPTFKDVRYGSFHRNVLDVYLPGDVAKPDSVAGQPLPVFIYFHGGGWIHGDKSSVDPSWYLKNGIAFVSANYRFTLGSPDAAPYPAPMNDAARVVQYVRQHASEWGLDRERIALSGSSAGAVMSMWVAYQDDLAKPDADDPVARESTRVQCVLPLNTPTTFDRDWILKHVGGSPKIHLAAYPFFAVQDLDELDAPEKRSLVTSASPVSHVSADDPPTYLRYSGTMEGTPFPPTTDPNISIHHPKFGEYLKQKLDQVGVPCVLRYRGDKESIGRDQFLKQHLIGR